MNIDTGEIRKFDSDEAREDFFRAMGAPERENWVEVDPSKMTTKQLKRMIVEENDHRSPTAVERDIARRQRRAARHNAEREARKEQP